MSNPSTLPSDTNPKDPQAELREAILGEVHLCGCQAMGADLEEVERLEHKTTEELFKLFQAHQQELLSELLGEAIEYELWEGSFVKAVPVEIIERLQNKTNDGGRDGASE